MEDGDWRLGLEGGWRLGGWGMGNRDGGDGEENLRMEGIGEWGMGLRGGEDLRLGGVD